MNDYNFTWHQQISKLYLQIADPLGTTSSAPVNQIQAGNDKLIDDDIDACVVKVFGSIEAVAIWPVISRKDTAKRWKKMKTDEIIKSFVPGFIKGGFHGLGEATDEMSY